MFSLRCLLLGLCRRTNILPSTLFISGVSCTDRDMVDAGACADIYLGSFGAQRIALKRLRTLPSNLPNGDKSVGGVWLIYSSLSWAELFSSQINSFEKPSCGSA